MSTSELSPAVVALAAAGVFLLALVGWRLLRADALQGWDVGDIVLLRDESKKQRRRGPLDVVSERLALRLGRLLGPRVLAELHRRIDLAGRPDGMTVESFLRLLVKYAVFLGSCAIMLLSLGRTLSALACLVATPLLPYSRVAAHRRRRQDTIDEDLPDFLDVLAVTVSAGIGFRTALGRVTQRFSGPLKEEMQLTLQQLDVGVPRRQAFSGLRARCESEPMSAFVAAFIQAEELGAPLAESLSTIARDTRRDAAQRARRKAARTVPRVTLIVSAVMVPPTLLVIGVGLYLGSGISLGGLLNG